MARPRFRLVETTADMGLIVWGRDYPALLEHAACGLSRLIGGAGMARRKGTVRRTVKAAGRDRESLLVAWLAEWLYLFEIEGFLGRGFTVNTSDGREARGTGIGRICDPGEGPLLTAVKGVTYHELRIEGVPGGLRARLVFDL